MKQLMTFRLSEQAIINLALLAKEWNLSFSETMERIIMEYAKKHLHKMSLNKL